MVVVSALVAALGWGLVRLVRDWRRFGDPGEGGGVASVPAPAAAQPRPQEIRIAASLRARFSYLRIDDAVLATFAGDYLRDRRHRWDGRAPFPDRDAMRFLMSTDFFQNGADESRSLRWVAYYNPYVSPCYNPLVEL